MRPPAAWPNVDLTGQPLLVLGWRPRPKALEAAVVDVRETAFGILRAVAEQALDDLASRTPVRWQPEAGLETGEEYLVVELSQGGPAAGLVDAGIADASSLLNLVLDPAGLGNVEPAQLAEGYFAFYAIVFEAADAGGPVAFVRAWDPTTLLRRARSWFRYEGSLEPAPPPDFAIDDRVDLVVTGTEIAVLSATAFDRMFADVRTLLADVPATVTSLTGAMTALPITQEAKQALTEVCSSRPSFARRLHRLAQSDVVGSLTSAELTRALRRHGEAPADYLTRGRLDLGPDQVRHWLDVVEGRWYSADFSGERRRADRYRAR